MELSHALSDAILTLTGLLVFFRYLRPLSLTDRLLWSAFVLAITGAAFFGVIRFTGYPEARPVSVIFQQWAATSGAVCLVLAVCRGIIRITVTARWVTIIVLAGVLLFGLSWLEPATAKITSMIAMPVVLALGIWGWQRGHKPESQWLTAAVLLLIAANFNPIIAAATGLDAIDLYHYLLAIAVWCFGRAASAKHLLAL